MLILPLPQQLLAEPVLFTTLAAASSEWNHTVFVLFVIGLFCVA
jgi:hypothetical protein